MSKRSTSDGYMSSVEKGSRKLDRFFKKMGGKSEMSIMQEKRREEDIKSGAYAKRKAESELDTKKYKEVVRKYHAEVSAGGNPINPYTGKTHH